MKSTIAMTLNDELYYQELAVKEFNSLNVSDEIKNALKSQGYKFDELNNLVRTNRCFNEVAAVILQNNPKSEVGEYIIKKNYGLVKKISNKYFSADDGKSSMEDMEQEMLLKLFDKGIPTYDVTKSLFSTYAYTIMKNEIVSMYNQLINKERGIEISVDSTIDEDEEMEFSNLVLVDNKDPEYYIKKYESEVFLRKALSKLSGKEKFVIYSLYGLDDEPLRQEDIAIELNVSQPAICKMKTKILRKLREYYQKNNMAF